MSADDENRFRPKPGRIRSDAPKAGKTKSFFTQVKKITRQHQAAASRAPSMPSSARPSSPARSRAVVASGKGVKRGRGASFVRARIVQRQLQIAPTLTIRPGFPVRIIVNRDLMFEPAGG